MKIVIKKGLDIPIKGGPQKWFTPPRKPHQIALNLDAFESVRFRLLVKVGQEVKIGTPLAENKAIPGQMFVSPAGGTVADIRRGLKRRLLSIVIATGEKEEIEELQPLDLSVASKEDILLQLCQGGIFPHISMRPFALVANRKDTPRAIFVRAIESLPFVPSAESQVEGHENDFHHGLQTLKKLTSGDVHLVFRENSPSRAFQEAEGVVKHTAEGPHPIGNSSLHIQKIQPIKHAEDIVWTLSAVDVVAVGKMISSGRYHFERVMSVAGGGLIEGRAGFFRGRAGYPIDELVAGRVPNVPLRFISGDPLTGEGVTAADFLGFHHTAFSIIPVNTTRERFHFLGLGRSKYSALRAYASGHFQPPSEGYDFTTSLHGEERAFVDGAIYDKVMPLHIPTMQLVKAILTENYELAVELGLLEVASEDFALPTFICPSKVEMVEIVKLGLQRYAKDMGHI